jgi:esterase
MLRYDRYDGATGKTLIILHGLFGSAKNFSSVAAALTPYATVYAYDARNHGLSHHTATHNLNELSEDLAEFIAEQQIQNPILIGHSLGGLTAMDYVRRRGDAVRALVVLDIAPRTYPLGHDKEIVAQKIMVSAMATRKDIDDVMQKVLPDATVRQFLQMNIGRDETGQFIWQNNIAAIEDSKSRTVFPPFENPLYRGPVLSIRGLRSDYVTNEDIDRMRVAFPLLESHDIPDAAHWLHHTHRDDVIRLISAFVQRV